MNTKDIIDEIFECGSKINDFKIKIVKLTGDLFNSNDKNNILLNLFKKTKIYDISFGQENYYGCLCIRLFIDGSSIKIIEAYKAHTVIFTKNENFFEFSLSLTDDESARYIYFPLDRNNIKDIINFFNLDCKKVIEEFKYLNDKLYVFAKVENELNIIFE